MISECIQGQRACTRMTCRIMPVHDYLSKPPEQQACAVPQMAGQHAVQGADPLHAPVPGACHDPQATLRKLQDRPLSRTLIRESSRHS